MFHFIFTTCRLLGQVRESRKIRGSTSGPGMLGVNRTVPVCTLLLFPPDCGRLRHFLPDCWTLRGDAMLEPFQCYFGTQCYMVSLFKRHAMQGRSKACPNVGVLEETAMLGG